MGANTIHNHICSHRQPLQVSDKSEIIRLFARLSDSSEFDYRLCTTSQREKSHIKRYQTYYNFKNLTISIEFAQILIHLSAKSHFNTIRLKIEKQQQGNNKYNG